MKIAVIDLDSVAYVIGNGNKVLGEDGLPIKVDGKFVYTDKTEKELQASADFVMKDILKASGATHYIGFVKGLNTTDARKAVYSGYKSNRSNIPPTWWEFVKKDLMNRWGAMQANGWEVDDYVNVTRLRLKEAFICAVDKDLLSLEGTHYNWKKREWVTISTGEAFKLFCSDLITGQTGDNIKGLPGRGPKFVEKLFNSYLIEEGHLSYLELVFRQYLFDFGEHEGIFEFYRNYTALKIVEDIPVFTTPKPIPVPDSIEQIRPAESFFIE
jgi:hypothetical protein